MGQTREGLSNLYRISMFRQLSSCWFDTHLYIYIQANSTTAFFSYTSLFGNTWPQIRIFYAVLFRPIFKIIGRTGTSSVVQKVFTGVLLSSGYDKKYWTLNSCVCLHQIFPWKICLKKDCLLIHRTQVCRWRPSGKPLRLLGRPAHSSYSDPRQCLKACMFFIVIMFIFFNCGFSACHTLF